MWVRRREWENLRITLQGSLEGVAFANQRVQRLEDELRRTREEMAALKGQVETLKGLIFGSPTQTPSKMFADDEALALERMLTGGANEVAGEPEGGTTAEE